MMLRFAIADMDCSEEVRALEHELVPLVGKEALHFNTLSRTMTVTVPDEDTVATRNAIITAVARTGMQARPMAAADPHPASGPLGNVGCSCCGQEKTRSQPKTGFGSANRRALLCAGSGALIALAILASLTAFPQAGHACLLAAAALGLYAVLPKAWYALRHAAPDMNLLMVIAVIGALIIGEWFEAATVSFLFALSNLLETWSTGKARRAIQSLLDITPRTALVLDADDTALSCTEQAVAAVPVGARLLVRPGDSIPMDGEVLTGHSFVNQAPITGESVPVEKEPGSPLFAGTVNGDGAIVMRATRLSDDSTLARILHMVEEAQGKKAHVLQWVEKFAAVYTPFMMAAALALGVLPPLLFGGGWSHWVYQALVLLVIACPCALVISTPVCITASLATAARHGVLIKGGVYLELPAHLDAVTLDKTGTLTTGEFGVRKIVSMGDRPEDDVLALAAALEGFSSHPLARAIKDEAARRKLTLPPVCDAAAVPGKGALGFVGRQDETARSYHIGSRRYLEENLGSGWTAAAVEALAASQDTGPAATEIPLENAVFLWNGNQVLGAIVATDTIRPEAVQAVRELKELGVADIIMLTGDNRHSAQLVAEQTGVTQVFAELMPEDKAKVVAELVRSGKTVAMIGDGINDAPALASASIGIAMGAAGTDVAIETADIALMADDLGKLPWLVHLARRNLGAIRQNIIFALSTKALFAILAVFGVASLWMAILADVGATLLVIANGMRLLRAPTAAGGSSSSGSPGAAMAPVSTAAPEPAL